MNKKLLAVICAMAMALSLAGCEQTGTSSNADRGTTSSAESSTTESSAEESKEESSAESEDGEYVKYELGGEITPTMVKNSRLNEGNKVRLANVFKKLAAGEEVTVAFIGGSITQGVSAGNDDCYAKLTYNWFTEKYPDAKINYVNAGIGATGSYIGVHRVQDEVISQKPDLVFVEFSVNDTEVNTARDKESYDSLLITLWESETKPAVVTLATTQDTGVSFQAHHLEIVQKYDIPMISYRNAILDVIDKGDIVWKDISDDNIHPNKAGHKVFSQLITNYLEEVSANADSITGEESNLSEHATAAGYVGGRFIKPGDEGVTLDGMIERDNAFGGFNGNWIAKTSDGDFKGASMTFDVKDCSNIGIVFGMTTANSCTFDVLVDGEKVKTINTDFSGGWGSYAECADIIRFDEKGDHTVQIVPNNTNDTALLYIVRLAVA